MTLEELADHAWLKIVQLIDAGKANEAFQELTLVLRQASLLQSEPTAESSSWTTGKADAETLTTEAAHYGCEKCVTLSAPQVCDCPCHSSSPHAL